MPPFSRGGEERGDNRAVERMLADECAGAFLLQKPRIAQLWLPHFGHVQSLDLVLDVPGAVLSRGVKVIFVSPVEPRGPRRPRGLVGPVGMQQAPSIAAQQRLATLTG